MHYITLGGYSTLHYNGTISYAAMPENWSTIVSVISTSVQTFYAFKHDKSKFLWCINFVFSVSQIIRA